MTASGIRKYKVMAKRSLRIVAAFACLYLCAACTTVGPWKNKREYAVNATDYPMKSYRFSGVKANSSQIWGKLEREYRVVTTYRTPKEREIRTKSMHKPGMFLLAVINTFNPIVWLGELMSKRSLLASSYKNSFRTTTKYEKDSSSRKAESKKWGAGNAVVLVIEIVTPHLKYEVTSDLKGNFSLGGLSRYLADQLSVEFSVAPKGAPEFKIHRRARLR